MEGEEKRVGGSERHTRSLGAEGPERLENDRERFMSSSPGEGVENAE
jgi:hypothetical protein